MLQAAVAWTGREVSNSTEYVLAHGLYIFFACSFLLSPKGGACRLSSASVCMSMRPRMARARTLDLLGCMLAVIQGEQ